MTITSFLIIKADFIIRVLQQVNDHTQKTVKEEVTTSGISKKRQHQYEYSAKERVDISKYSAEVLQFPYHIQ